jgi:4-amino-4-deoxy-L-arabinose transferase-like glycosyltransferase
MGLALLGLALAGIARTLWARDAEGLVLLSFTAAYYGLMSSAELIFVRYMTPRTPVLCLFAAMAVLSLAARLRWPRLRVGVAAALSLVAVLEPLGASIRYARLVQRIDTRADAGRFI